MYHQALHFDFALILLSLKMALEKEVQIRRK
jgi:hypothetical protein